MASDAQLGPYIEFKEVSKSFGEHCVLDHVSFDVMAGETVCILGRSGVGKSVTRQNIMGFLKPDSGRVIVAHEDITDYGEPDLERIRKKVTIVFQNGALFDSLSVGENVAFPLRYRGVKGEAAAAQIAAALSRKNVARFAITKNSAIAASVIASAGTGETLEREKYVTVGEIASNAASASAPTRPSGRRSANASATSSTPPSAKPSRAT